MEKLIFEIIDKIPDNVINRKNGKYNWIRAAVANMTPGQCARVKFDSREHAYRHQQSIQGHRKDRKMAIMLGNVSTCTFPVDESNPDGEFWLYIEKKEPEG